MALIVYMAEEKEGLNIGKDGLGKKSSEGFIFSLSGYQLAWLCWFKHSKPKVVNA